MSSKRRFLILAVALVGASIVAVVIGTQGPAQRAAEAPQAAAVANTFRGWLDAPANEALFSRRLVVEGWAASEPTRVQDVSVRLPAQVLQAQYGLPRADVVAALGSSVRTPAVGFRLDAAMESLAPARYPFSVVATLADGSAHVLGKRSVIPPEAMTQWATFAADHARARFSFLMATSGIAKGGAAEVADAYRGYASSSQQVGIAVPILYMRTTFGRQKDWRFDSAFDTTRKCGDRLLAEDALDDVMAFAIKQSLPVQFILNGGIWADAACNDPDWDLNDHLEDDPANCQWTQDDKVYPDDYLKNLTGSMSSPELGRSLTFNAYATTVRAYKKRNLQAAAGKIAAFAKDHPDLFVGINLDADTYLNPFYEQREWFDYNPGTVRQFREWLQGTGPYARPVPPGIPDLRRFRREKALSLADVNRLARARWTRWSDVEPPRRFPGALGAAPASGEPLVWEDAWYQTWDTFRKQLVAAHYDELARWTYEAGIPREKIFTAQGFVAPEGNSRPFAIRIASSGQNYDSGGVSIEGAKPADGHIGAILYGAAAENRSRMETRHALFATFARMDDAWAVVETNLADLKDAQRLPEYASAYHAFRDLFNFDARQVSLMSWNGSNGLFAGQPGYVAYTSWRNTPSEEAMRDHLVSHAGLPLGSRLWAFGSMQHADTDGWEVDGGTLQATPGALIVAPTRASPVTFLSPSDQVIRPQRVDAMVLGIPEDACSTIEVSAQEDPAGDWLPIAGEAQWKQRRLTPAGLTVSLSWPTTLAHRIVERIKIACAPANGGRDLRVDHIALVRDAVPGVKARTAQAR